MLKKFLLFLLIALVVIQFFRPEKNVHPGHQPYALSNEHPVPADVQSILQVACYDCHTNNTRYPWYSKIQPFAWWLARHVDEGKEHFNFDEYTNRRPRYKYHKMEEVVEQIDKGEMPLKSYTWTHKDARLTEEQKAKLIAWANSVMDQLKGKYPIDSLVRRN